MSAWLRRRFSYANVVATLALLFAMSGGAVAASHYLLSSTRQISPKVLKELRGKPGAQGTVGTQGPAGPQGSGGAQGPAGPQGAAGAKGAQGERGAPGAQGATGANGKDGSPWTVGGTLPSGSSETGTWAASGPPAEVFTKYAVSIASFSVPLASPPAVQTVGPQEGEGEAKENLPAGCKGNHKEPKAEKGNLCVFEIALTPNVGSIEVSTSTAGAIGRIEIANGTEEYVAFGTWAVTAE